MARRADTWAPHVSNDPKRKLLPMRSRPTCLRARRKRRAGSETQELCPRAETGSSLAEIGDAVGLHRSRVGKSSEANTAVSFHTFRHTCASLLFEAGRNVKQVQAWLGHADPGFTLKTYIHLMDSGVGSPDFLDEAASVNQSAAAAPTATLDECLSI